MFLEDCRGNAITVNTEQYNAMLQTFLTSATWFQQDGATWHISNDLISAVREVFGQKVISKRCDINWTLRSPDLSSMDFFLSLYLKSQVFNNIPVFLHELKEPVRGKMQNISRNNCESVTEKFRSRLQQCQDHIWMMQLKKNPVGLH